MNSGRQKGDLKDCARAFYPGRCDAGGIPLEREAVVFEKVYVLLTRVCRAITLLRDVPPDEQRTRVQLVQRGAWQVLLSLAQRRVCVAVFAAAFLDFLPGALAQANTASGHLPQRLLLTVAWVRACPALARREAAAFGHSRPASGSRLLPE